ncbi:LruC domain-containing protein [Leptospira gomenensis]|uniref:LruC domain-containing protein n=1 Tax=Leptospira gomenensis TaxID=2484974 RepID=A0A5F1YAQ6_9LEPT|nr:LruC domain-containing protein [Leptospira gomenensis]TGK33850.1 LruC domain-containing protein [Leptospira gomenensis]TGK36305.1 LruC domain-containing protein [Leptospira gomenensis]TGK52075.1 LruC domain-containing protein [Leptospira gomenensis]TGK59876.1 LruC domain-containing protein [Leptospira gomenensis]
MKKLVITLLILSVGIACSHKKKGALWPLLFLLNPGSQTEASSGASSETATASNGGKVVIVDNTGSGSGSSGAPSSPTSPSSGGSNSSGSGTGSNSSNSGSGSSSDATSGSDSGSSNNSGSNGGSSSSEGSVSSGNTSGSGDTGTGASSGGSSSGGSSDSGANAGTGSSSSSSGENSSGSGTGSSSGGSEVGSGSNSGSSNENANAGGTETNTPGTGPSSDNITGVITVNDQVGTPVFNYNTVQTIPLNLAVLDKQSKPVSGATVIVSDLNGNILFQGISASDGKVSGTVTVETSVGQITLEISTNGESITNIINLINVIGIDREIKYEILLPAVALPTDSDADGIPDSLDVYPQDATRASSIRTPAEGVSTVAYEDLYPSAGDADLNDYVLHIHNEVDLNAAGEVVRLRGTYQHVARGAGYKHTFFLKLPVSVGASFTRKVVREDGKEITASNTRTVSASDLNQGIQIHEESNKTTSNPNVNPGGVFKPGHIATIEIQFQSPVKKSVLGNYPYDIFIKVTNTGKEIHFPGLYKNSNGTDKYLDSNQFPWAILVPGTWKYPYEGLDIRKDSQSGYGEFNLWVASNGTQYKEWYKHITNETKVFPVPDEDSGLLGFLLASVKKNAIFAALLLIAAGAGTVFFLKRRVLSQV